MRHDAAVEKGIELVSDELRQVGAGRVLNAGEQGLGVLLQQSV